MSAIAMIWRKPTQGKPKQAPLLGDKENSLHRETTTSIDARMWQKLCLSCCKDTERTHTQFLSCMGLTLNYIIVSLFGYGVKTKYQYRIIYTAILGSRKTCFLIITLLLGGNTNYCSSNCSAIFFAHWHASNVYTIPIPSHPL
jgi:hypothetical protein